MRRFSRVLTMAVLLAAALPCVAEEGVQQFAELGRCALDSGKAIEHCRVGYRTLGTRNAGGSNVVLMPTWLYGTSAGMLPLAGPGPGKLIDTTKYYVVLLDALGDGVSSSPSNSPTQKGPAFPAITERDMVRAEYRAVTETLHLKHAHAIAGISMGGEQVFGWAVMYPQFFDLAIPIVGTPQPTSYDLLSHTLRAQAIENDPEYQHGHYTSEPKLTLANEILYLQLTTPEYRVTHTPREDFPTLLETAGRPMPLDANDRLWQLRAVLGLDVTGGRPLEEVAKSSPSKWLVISSAQDHTVYPGPALAWAKAAGAEVYLSDTPCGHLIMECDGPEVSRRVERFLAQ